MNNNWPPNYTSVFKNRQKNYLEIKNNPVLIKGAIAYYKNANPIEFINDWCMTYDPRNIAKSLPPTLPMILFPKQEELVAFVMDCLTKEECGIIEKTRDMGATWTLCSLSVYLWRFRTGISIGWGSRKQELVDRIGDPDSIFEKIRMTLNYLPDFFIPKGFNPKRHATHMKLINPENGSTITGEIGDEIGRGGRKTIYFPDEAAHLERPEKIEASLGDNTNCRIDLSSVNGNGNVFARRRHNGIVWEKNKEIAKGQVRVMIMDWRDHPHKTQEWYDLRRSKAEREGLMHIFAQEVDRDYSAAVTGVLIPNKWVKAAIDAHIKLGIKEEGSIISCLDVGDSEDGDINALSSRKGIVLNYLDGWGDCEDTGLSANRAVTHAQLNNVADFYYDCIGVGSGIKAETNRLKREGSLPKNLKIHKWDASATVINPNGRVIKGDKESPKNKDFYASLGAQGWWQLRVRFQKTYNAINEVTGNFHTMAYDPSELISISSKIDHLHELVTELSQPLYDKNGAGKIIIDKKPPGTISPNYADTVRMNYWPVKRAGYLM